MPARFVILHHEAPDGEHWDLMLERGEILLTWRLEHQPFDESKLPIPARRIFDHRKAFLDYEGPLRGDRGRVRRVDAGSVRFEQFTDSQCVIVLQGGRLNGRFTLIAEGDAWTFARLETF